MSVAARVNRGAVVDLLDDLRGLGVEVYRDGSEVCLWPKDALTPEVLDRVLRCKAELLPTLPTADEVYAKGLPEAPVPSSAAPHPGRYGLGRCFDCGSVLPAGVEIALCRVCRVCRNPGATDMPEPRPPYPLHVVVEDEVIATSRSGVAADVAVLRRVVEDYSWCWHDDARAESATDLGERIDELVERLKSNGCDVRVEPLS